MSGLKISSIGLNALGTTQIPVSSQSVRVSSLSWKIVMGPRFRVSSERLEKPGIEPTTTGLEGVLVPGCMFSTLGPHPRSPSSPLGLSSVLAE